MMAGGKIHVMDCPHCGGAIYKPDGRAAPKIHAADMFQAIKALGAGATQAQVAKQLGVGKSTVSDWLKREGRTWDELKREALGLGPNTEGLSVTVGKFTGPLTLHMDGREVANATLNIIRDNG